MGLDGTKLGQRPIKPLYWPYKGGEVKVILANLGSEPFAVRRGERIAQLVPAPVLRAELTEVAELDETVRGAGGFGSTGR